MPHPDGFALLTCVYGAEATFSQPRGRNGLVDASFPLPWFMLSAAAMFRRHSPSPLQHVSDSHGRLATARAGCRLPAAHHRHDPTQYNTVAQLPCHHNPSCIPMPSQLYIHLARSWCVHWSHRCHLLCSAGCASGCNKPFLNIMTRPIRTHLTLDLTPSVL